MAPSTADAQPVQVTHVVQRARAVGGDEPCRALRPPVVIEAPRPRPLHRIGGNGRTATGTEPVRNASSWVLSPAHWLVDGFHASMLVSVTRK